MVGIKVLRDNAILVMDEDGELFLYDRAGKIKEKHAQSDPKYFDGMQMLPIVSILIGSSTGSAEIKTFNCGSDIVCEVDEHSALAYAVQFQKLGNVVRVLQDNGKVGNTRYSQIVIIYRDGYDLVSEIRKMGL